MKLCLALLCLFVNVCQAQTTGKTAVIAGVMHSLRPVDTMVLTIYQYGGGYSGNQDFEQTYYAQAHHGKFTFSVELEHIAYFKLEPLWRYGIGLSGSVLEAGDRLQVDFGDQDISVVRFNQGTRVNSEKLHPLQLTGNGASRLELMEYMKKWNLPTGMYKVVPDDPASLARLMKSEDSLAIEKLTYLETHRSAISNAAYALLQADILCGIVHQGISSRKNFKILAEAAVISNHQNLVNLCLVLLKNSPDGAYAAGFSDAIINYETIELMQQAVPDSAILSRLNAVIASRYRGLQRDLVLSTLAFNNRLAFQENIAPVVDTALHYVTTPAIRTFLERMKTNQLAGTTAFPFAAPDTKGNQRTLQEFTGKVVILDYFYTGCGACRRLAPILAKAEEDYKNKDVVFIGVSIDKNREGWLESVQSGAYTNPSMVNLYTNGNGMDHALIKDYFVTGFPTLVIIDKKGKRCRPVKRPVEDDGKDLKTVIDTALKM